MNQVLSLAERNALMRAAAGADAPDLAIVGGMLANVLSGEFHPADILVKDGRVVRLVEPGEVIPLAGVEVVDAAGRYVVPGLIDPRNRRRLA